MTLSDSNQSFGLRYMQLDISRETAHDLPGVSFTNSFKVCEFVSRVSSNEIGMVCFLKVSFDDPKALEESNPAFELLEVISQTNNAALIKAQTLGPLPKIFSSNEEVWWISPTYVSRNGMKILSKMRSESVSDSDLVFYIFSLKFQLIFEVFRDEVSTYRDHAKCKCS